MFVSDKSLGANPKLYFFNDKELPAKGSKSERLVLQFLELLSNPKAVTPHTNIFSMDKKNQFVTNAVCVMVTPTQKAFIEHLLQNATAYNHYLIDALERATHFCELDLTKSQLRQDYLLRDFSAKLLQITNPKNLN